MNELPLNQILCGDCTEIMTEFPADSIDLAVTSPPYWGLRDYGKETARVWGGLPECEHEWGKEIIKKGKSGGTKSSTLGEKSGGHAISEEGVVRSITRSFHNETKSNFCTKCGAWRGSLGLEPHPQLFIDHLVEICREIKRVLKPTGTFWLNLGDSYCSGHGPINKDFNKRSGDASGMRKQEHKRPSIIPNKSNWLQPKQLLLIPSRVAIALQDDGWILRNDIIWHKPNHMPSSAKDRLTCAYEHVFLFVKNNETIYWVDRFTGQLTASKPRQYYVHDETGEKRFDRPIKGVDKGWFNENGIATFNYAWQGHDYYFDLDAIRQPQSESTLQRITQPNVMNQLGGDKQRELRGEGGGNASRSADMVKSLVGSSKGKNPGDVWRIPTMPFPGAHFAVFPPKLIAPIIKAGCPRLVCSKCGKPRIRISEPTQEYSKKLGKSVHDHKNDLKRGMRYDKVCNAEYVTVGWSDCGCGADWGGGIVLDPFAGSGTALRVARRLRRRFIGIEISPEYVEMARQRVRADKYQEPPKGVPTLTEAFEDVHR